MGTLSFFSPRAFNTKMCIRGNGHPVHHLFVLFTLSGVTQISFVELPDLLCCLSCRVAIPTQRQCIDLCLFSWTFHRICRNCCRKSYFATFVKFWAAKRKNPYVDLIYRLFLVHDQIVRRKFIQGWFIQWLIWQRFRLLLVTLALAPQLGHMPPPQLATIVPKPLHSNCSGVTVKSWKIARGKIGSDW